MKLLIQKHWFLTLCRLFPLRSGAKRTVSVLPGFNSIPFIRSQQWTSSTHSERASKAEPIVGLNVTYTCTHPHTDDVADHVHRWFYWLVICTWQKNRGQRTVPCGTSVRRATGLERAPPTPILRTIGNEQWYPTQCTSNNTEVTVNPSQQEVKDDSIKGRCDFQSQSSTDHRWHERHHLSP